MVEITRSAMTRRHREQLWAVVLLAPALAVLGIFRVWPTLEMVILSLQQWNGFSSATWTGVSNFQALWHDRLFWTAIRNNAIVVACGPVWVLFPLLVTLPLHRRIRGWRFFRFVFVLPIIISSVFIGLSFKVLLSYDGPINSMFRSLGLGFLAKQWLTQTSTALASLIVLGIWATFGIGMLIFWAALDGVDTELYAAAQVDGASPFQTYRYITIPAIRPALEFWSVIVVILTFTNLFPLVYTLTGGGPGRSTQVLEYNIYQSAFQNSEYGYANAMGVVLFVLVLGLTLLTLGGYKLRSQE